MLPPRNEDGAMTNLEDDPVKPLASLNGAAPSSDPTQAALTRLASSRQRLLQSLAPQRPDDDQHGPGWSTRFPRRLRALGRMLMSRGPSAALFRAAAATARQWWQTQPWATSSEMLGRALAQEVRPLVRRHPWSAVGIALGFGAAAVAAKPWIWRNLQPYAATLGARVRRAAWSVFAQAPVQMALTAVMTAWLAERQRQASSDEASTEHPPATTV